MISLSLADIAERVMTVGIKESEILESWDYRKGKSIEDIKHAVKKSRNPKNGMYKIEYEIDFLELYLKDILKRKRIKKE